MPPIAMKFVVSATRVEDLPETEREVAIVGRSNVGKSSLINAVANTKGLARVSQTPGQTQLLNLFQVAKGSTVVCTVTGNGLKDPDTALKGMPAVTPVPVDPVAVAAQLGLV